MGQVASRTQAGLEIPVGFMALKDWLAKFPKKFYAVFRSQAARNPSADRVEENRAYHLLSRYIFQSGHFNARNAKPGAFLPHSSMVKTSAVWIDQLSVGEVWEIGDVLASQSAPPRKPPIARADFDVASLVGTNLTVEDDTKLHPRHVNLCGWPPEKDAQKAVALLLCSRANLNIR
jgi:hypothetical protein